MKKLNTCEFIDKALIIHKHEYDYSLVDYVNSETNNYHLLRIGFNEINEIDKILDSYEPIFKR
jgi:hypothetical protein